MSALYPAIDTASSGTAGLVHHASEGGDGGGGIGGRGGKQVTGACAGLGEGMELTERHAGWLGRSARGRREAPHAPAERAPLPARRDRLSAGSSDRSRAGQLERAASSRRVCFLDGCCHRSGCVFASYACGDAVERIREGRYR
jgi:hypothetical protein